MKLYNTNTSKKVYVIHDNKHYFEPNGSIQKECITSCYIYDEQQANQHLNEIKKTHTNAKIKILEFV